MYLFSVLKIMVNFIIDISCVAGSKLTT